MKKFDRGHLADEHRAFLDMVAHDLFMRLDGYAKNLQRAAGQEPRGVSKERFNRAILPVYRFVWNELGELVVKDPGDM